MPNTSCKIHLICGPLGSGKTTLLRKLFNQKPEHENWAIIVNEFGAIGIDQAILHNPQLDTLQIPGGCICCSALTELQDAILQLLNQQQYHRIFIEPSGLSEIDSLVDLLKQLQNYPTTAEFQLANTVCILPANQITVPEWQRNLSLQNLTNMADILIVNKTDLCSAKQIEILMEFADRLYPPKQAILSTKQSQIDFSHLQQPKTTKIHFLRAQEMTKTLSSYSQPHLHSTQTFSEVPEHPFILNFQHLQSNLSHSYGWIFSEQAIFDWQKLATLFTTLNTPHTHLLRLKGVFRVGKPWMLFQLSHQQLSRELIAYRNDSRIELLFEVNSNACAQNFSRRDFQQALLNCISKSSCPNSRSHH